MTDKKEIIQKALELKEKGEYEQSLKVIREGLHHFSDSQDLKTLLIKVLFEYAGMLMDDWVVDYEKSLECYQEIAEMDPKNYRALYNMGISLFSLGKHDEALIRFDEALKVKPDYKYCYYNIGLVYEEKGLLQKAYNAYKRALELDSNFSYAKEAKRSVETRIKNTSNEEGGSACNRDEPLEQLKSLMRVSKRINIIDLQHILGMSRQQLLKVLIVWAENYGFEIDGDYLVINKQNLPQFFEHLDLDELL